MATFSPKSLDLIAPAVVRVTFDKMPFSAHPERFNDGLNPANYSVSGPSQISIDRVSTVSGNPYALDLVFHTRLAVGTWQISITNIEAPIGGVITATTLQLNITGTQKFLTNGKQSTAEDVVKTNLNPKFGGVIWNALASAYGYADELISQLAKSAFFQNFFSTASGQYLERLTTSISLDRAPNTGASDETLRKLAIAINSNRLINRAYLEVLRAYYGEEATTAWIKSESTAPFSIQNGSTLSLVVNRKPVTIVFQNNDFQNITQATALEVSQVINRYFLRNEIVASAKVVSDPETGLDKAEVLSGWLGLSGSIVVTGGSAESVLRFPKIIPTLATTGTTWKILTHSSDPTIVPYGMMWLQWIGGTDPQIQDVYRGDFALLYDTAFNVANRGSFIIDDVGVYLGNKYLQIGNQSAVAQNPIVQSSTSLVMFLDDESTTLSQISNYYATATQPWPNQVDVLLPATASAIERTRTTAWYSNGEKAKAIDEYGAFRASDGLVTIGFPQDHGISVGDYVELSEFTALDERDPYFSSTSNITVSYPVPFALYPSVKLDDGRVFIRRQDDWVIYDSTTDTWAEYTQGGLVDRYGSAAIKLQNGRVLIVGGSTSPTTCEIYDPDTNAIVPAGNTNGTYGTNAARLALRPTGDVVMVGDTAAVCGLEIFNPNTNLWTIYAPLAGAPFVDNPEVVVDTSNIIWVWDGIALTSVNTVGVGDLWTYFPAPFRKFGKMIFVPRGPGGQIWYLGGYDNGGTAVSTLIRFDITSGVFDSSTSLSHARAHGVITPLINGYYLLINGTTLPNASMPTGLTNGPAPELINVFALKDTLITRDLSSELTINYEPLTPVQTLNNGEVFVASATQPIYHKLNLFQQTAKGHIEGFFKVTGVPTSDSIEIQTDTYWRTTWRSGFVTKTDASAGTIKSGYCLDPSDGVTINDNQSQLTTAITPGPAPSTMYVGAISLPDDPGYLVLDFGYETESPPIKYLGTAGTTQIRLDPGYTFSRGYQVGTNVSFLASTSPYAPKSTLGMGVTYATASSAGRLAASSDIDDIKAVGLTVNKTVLYPGDQGLGGEGLPAEGAQKLSDKVYVWGGDTEQEIEAAREGDSGA